MDKNLKINDPINSRKSSINFLTIHKTQKPSKAKTEIMVSLSDIKTPAFKPKKEIVRSLLKKFKLKMAKHVQDQQNYKNRVDSTISKALTRQNSSKARSKLTETSVAANLTNYIHYNYIKARHADSMSRLERRLPFSVTNPTKPVKHKRDGILSQSDLAVE